MSSTHSSIRRILSSVLAKSNSSQASILLVGDTPGEEVLVQALPGAKESRYVEAFAEVLQDVYSEGAPAVGRERGIVQLLLPGARGAKLAIIPIMSGKARIGTLNVSLPEGEAEEAQALRFWTGEAESIAAQLAERRQGSEIPEKPQGRLPDDLAGMGLREVRERALREIEGEYLRGLLSSTNGNISKAARQAGVTRRTLYNKMNSFGIQPKRARKKG